MAVWVSTGRAPQCPACSLTDRKWERDAGPPLPRCLPLILHHHRDHSPTAAGEQKTHQGSSLRQWRCPEYIFHWCMCVVLFLFFFFLNAPILFSWTPDCTNSASFWIMWNINLAFRSHHISSADIQPVTCLRAESLGACWMSRRLEFWAASCSVMRLYSGCCGVRTKLGWLHSFLRYCSAWENAEMKGYVTAWWDASVKDIGIHKALINALIPNSYTSALFFPNQTAFLEILL